MSEKDRDSYSGTQLGMTNASTAQGYVGPQECKAPYREPTQIVTFVYRNWKGEIRERRVVPINIEFTSDHYHQPVQWIMHAIDVDKGARRSFAFRNMLTAPKGE